VAWLYTQALGLHSNILELQLTKLQTSRLQHLGMDHIENTALLLRGGRLRALHSNGRYLKCHRLATGLYAAILTVK
jgi:hypothetical protein